jgi:molecular chaperone DnaK
MSDLGFGIDFGTTNSVVAVCSSKIQKIDRLTSKTTNLPHPSVVWYSLGNQPVVGEDAKRNILKHEKRDGHQFVRSIKRMLGKADSLVVLGEKRPVHQVAADIFTHLKNDAKTQSGGYDIAKAVVTVPIDFDGKARRELRRAAEKAGIYVNTFVHEPFAAVVGHCYRNEIGLEIGPLLNKKFLVFDWGGGTLDITLVKIDKHGMVELSTAGINDQSGDYFDGLLVHFAKNRLAERFQIDPRELSFTSAEEGVLLSECEQKKLELSNKLSERLQVIDGVRIGEKYHDIDEPVLRKDFEKLIKQTVDRAIGTLGKVLEDARVPDAAVDAVLLIGGSSRIPLVQDALRKKFGSRLTNVSNADTIIAEGAAIVDALKLLPVFSGDVEVELSDQTLYTVFSRGIQIKPGETHRTLPFYCTDQRDGEAKLIVVQSDHSDTEPRVFMREVLGIPVDPNLPKQYKHERVVVDFDIDKDMVLQLAGKARSQDNGSSSEVHRLSFGLHVG